MNIRSKLISAAERTFDLNGFSATGMARLIQEAGISSRTVYKHAGSKTGLIAAVLAERDRRFFANLDCASVDGLFASLEEWMRGEGARGCLFFRAQAETGGDTPDIEAVVAAYRSRLHKLIAELVAAETGDHDAELTEQILVLFEGATAAATYRGTGAVAAARAAAHRLIASDRP